MDQDDRATLQVRHCLFGCVPAAGHDLRRRLSWLPLLQELEREDADAKVRDPARWTILQQDGPDHLGFWYKALPEHQVALIASGCVAYSTSWPWKSCAGHWQCCRCVRALFAAFH